MKKPVKTMKNVVAKILSMVMTVSVLQTMAFQVAAVAEITLDFIPTANETAEDTTAIGTTATIKGTSVKIYEDLYYGAPGVEVAVAENTQIDLITAYEFSNGAVVYRFDYRGSESPELYNAVLDYYFIAATDIMVAGEEPEATIAPETTATPEAAGNTELSLTDPNTGITITGVLPVGTRLVVGDVTTSNISGLAVSHMAYKTVSHNGYNISLVDADGNALAEDAFGTVTVYVPGVWNTSYSDPIVDVYHLNDDGTLKEMLTSRDESVLISEDGGITFKISSFSDYWFVSGDTDSNLKVTQGKHEIYIVPGSSGTLLLEATKNVTLNSVTPVSGVAVNQSTSDNKTIFTITADSSATPDTEGSFIIAWGKDTPKTASYTVHVVSAEEAERQEYLANKIDHIQINIVSAAVILGYENNAETQLDFNFDEVEDSVTPTKVADDSAVGYHYELIYSVTDDKDTEDTSDDVTRTYKVIVAVDEAETKYPSGMTKDEVYEYIAETWTFKSVTIDGGQISFNSGDSGQSQTKTIPVGTKESPIVYKVTVEGVFDKTPNGENATEEVEVSVSNSVGYWYENNECPGIGIREGDTDSNDNGKNDDWDAGKVVSASGIDLSKFQTGTVLGDTTYYVVFSNLTKVVNGYAFGDNESKNYVFTIYRRTADTTDDWTAFDTISITANGATSNTNFTTDATKYSVDDIDRYEYKIVETGYSISGYGCTNVIEVKNDGSYATATDGVFTFNRTESADSKTVTYSAEIKCTNTYSEAGLTISKVTQNAPSSAADDTFTVRVTPNVLSTTGVTLGDGQSIQNYFNTGSYKVADTAVTVTDGSDSAYGYIEFTIKGGESKTITGLPAGTYYIQEIAGINTNWTYDTNRYEANLSSGSAVVTVTNIYNSGSLEVHKTVMNNAVNYNSTNDTFTVKVKVDGYTGSNITYKIGDTVYTKTIGTDGYVIITLANGQSAVFENLPANASYDVIEVLTDDQSAVYTSTITKPDGESKIIAGEKQEVTITNTVKTGTLIIDKNISLPQGVSVADNETFAFTVTGPNGYNNEAVSITKDGQTEILNLLVGEYTVVENLDANQQKIYTTSYGTEDGKATVTDGQTANVTVTNAVTAGKLDVTKTVFDPTYDSSNPKKFTMEITLTGDIVVTEMIGTVAGVETNVTVTDGKATIQLADGETAQFTNVPVGVTYKVTETGVDTGYYTVSYSNATGTIATDTPLVTVTNTRNYGKLTITKKIQDTNGKDLSANAGETFVFNITKPDGKTMQVVIAGTGSVTLTNLPLGSYTVTEDQNWSYKYTAKYGDANVVNVTAEVTSTADGHAVIINVPEDDKWLKSDAYAENKFAAITTNAN